MEDEDCLRKYYAKCLAKLQIEFIKDRNPRVKDLIRLLKYWKYTENVCIYLQLQCTLTRFRIHYGSTIFICNLSNDVICIQETQNSFICTFQPRNTTAIRDQPFNLHGGGGGGGGGYVFGFVQKFVFGQHELEYFFLSR